MANSFAEYVSAKNDYVQALHEAYISDAKDQGTWGSEVEGSLLANIYRVKIVFWKKNRQNKYQHVQTYGSGSKTIHILNQGNHFESIKVTPIEGAPVNRENIQENSGGGDCLYKAFFQGYTRHGNEPSPSILSTFRSNVALAMKNDSNFDLVGFMVHLMDEYEDWGFAPGIGSRVYRLFEQYYNEYITQNILGGGSVPPFGFGQDNTKKIGVRDTIPRNKLSRSDRMIDRIGRLIATKKSVHAAVALDEKVLVISCNDDSDNVRTYIRNLVNYYGKNQAVNEDPKYGVGAEERVKDGVTGVSNGRRDKDIRKMKAFKAGQLEELSDGLELEKLQAIKAAIQAGLYDDMDNSSTNKNRYIAQEPGIYFIPHYSGDQGVVHGEMTVTHVIKERRKNLTTPCRNVFIGGTLIDCYDCNRAHKASNVSLKKAKATWRFYSGGTHGNSFPNWYLTLVIRNEMDEDTFKSERFDGNPHTAVRTYTPYHDYYDGRYRDCYGYRNGNDYKDYYDVDKWGNRRYHRNGYYYEWVTPIHWQDTERTRRRDLNITQNFDDWHRDYTEQWYKRKSACQPSRTPHSFADDSDSDTDEYDEIIITRKKINKKFRMSDAFNVEAFQTLGSPTRLPKFRMADSIIVINIPRQLLFQRPQIPTTRQSFALVCNTKKQQSGFTFQFQSELKKLFTHLNSGQRHSQLNPTVIEAMLKAIRSREGTVFVQPQNLPQITHSNQTSTTLITNRLFSPEYIDKMYRIFSELYIPSRYVPQSNSRELQTRNVNQQGTYFDICLANIFECFLSLVDLIKPDKLFFSGTLHHCLVQVQQTFSRNSQEGIQTNQEINTIRILYFYLTFIFNQTGLGYVMLTDLLRIVDESE